MSGLKKQSANIPSSAYEPASLPSMKWYKFFRGLLVFWIVFAPIKLTVDIIKNIYEHTQLGRPPATVFLNPFVQCAIIGTALLCGMAMKLRAELGKYSPAAIPFCIYSVIARIAVSAVAVILYVYYLGADHTLKVIGEIAGSTISYSLFHILTYFYLKKRMAYLGVLQGTELLRKSGKELPLDEPSALELAANTTNTDTASVVE